MPCVRTICQYSLQILFAVSCGTLLPGYSHNLPRQHHPKYDQHITGNQQISKVAHIEERASEQATEEKQEGLDACSDEMSARLVHIDGSAVVRTSNPCNFRRWLHQRRLVIGLKLSIRIHQAESIGPGRETADHLEPAEETTVLLRLSLNDELFGSRIRLLRRGSLVMDDG